MVSRGAEGVATDQWAVHTTDIDIVDNVSDFYRLIPLVALGVALYYV